MTTRPENAFIQHLGAIQEHLNALVVDEDCSNEAFRGLSEPEHSEIRDAFKANSERLNDLKESARHFTMMIYAGW